MHETTAPRLVHLNARPTLGQAQDSPRAWTATLVFGTDPTAPSAPGVSAVGMYETWAIEALLTEVHTLYHRDEITLSEATLARLMINDELDRLEHLGNSSNASSNASISVSTGEKGNA